ncbi:La protein 1, partial [Mucuna pruriens]
MATQLLDEETAKKVLRQVEFYFSDSNLLTDGFMRKSITEGEDGIFIVGLDCGRTVISLPLICSFKRMRMHLNLGDARADEVPQDIVNAVAQTLRTSASLKVSEDGGKVGKTTELPKKEKIEQAEIRTLAVSPFEYDLKLEDVEKFFGQYGKVNTVRLPHHVGNKNFFCGTAIVEFSSREEVEKVMKEKLVYEGVELELKPKKDFDAERVKELEDYKKSRLPVDSNYQNNSNVEEEDYPKGLIIAFKLQSISEEIHSKQNGVDQQANDNSVVSKTADNPPSGITSGENDQMVTENVNNNEDEMKEGKETETEENNEMKEAKETESEVNIEVKEGKITEGEENNRQAGAKFSAASYKDNMDVVSREDLRSVFQKFGTVKYIDFKIGEKSGYIRFEETEAAQKARTAAVISEKAGLVVKNYIATLEPVIGQAEREYWRLLRGNQGKQREFKNKQGRGGRKHGRWGKHARPRENESRAGRPNKAQKTGAA